MARSLINNSMRINDIVKEFVEQGLADANKTALDLEVMKSKKLEVAAQDSEDPEAEEAIQDLPS